MPIRFDQPPSDSAELEQGAVLTPRFDRDGLIAALVTDARDGHVLMLAHMNDEALALTIETGIAHFYSRSRQRIWKKGESSGNLLHVKSLRVDCDQDAVWIAADVGGHGATCHTGRRSCFYRTLARSDDGSLVLVTDDEPARFDPDEIYGNR